MMTGNNSVVAWNEVKEGWIIKEKGCLWGGDAYVQYMPYCDCHVWFHRYMHRSKFIKLYLLSIFSLSLRRLLKTMKTVKNFISDVCIYKSVSFSTCIIFLSMCITERNMLQAIKQLNTLE